MIRQKKPIQAKTILKKPKIKNKIVKRYEY